MFVHGKVIGLVLLCHFLASDAALPGGREVRACPALRVKPASNYRAAGGLPAETSSGRATRPVRLQAAPTALPGETRLLSG